MAKDDSGAPTPAAAVARHLEWLEYALDAAREEETRRSGRLERASDKNREKRTIRLAEVTAEIRELEALLAGLRDLEARANGSSAPRTELAPASPNGAGTLSVATSPDRGARPRKAARRT